MQVTDVEYSDGGEYECVGMLMEGGDVEIEDTKTNTVVISKC